MLWFPKQSLMWINVLRTSFHFEFNIIEFLFNHQHVSILNLYIYLFLKNIFSPLFPKLKWENWVAQRRRNWKSFSISLIQVCPEIKSEKNYICQHDHTKAGRIWPQERKHGTFQFPVPNQSMKLKTLVLKNLLNEKLRQ